MNCFFLPCTLAYKVEIIQANPQIFSDGLSAATPASHLRRMSEISIQSTVSGVIDSLPLHTINACEFLSCASPCRLLFINLLCSSIFAVSLSYLCLFVLTLH